MTEEMKKLVEKSMYTTANFYAQRGEMTACVAVHDAFLCLMDAVEKGFVSDSTTVSEVKEW